MAKHNLIKSAIFVAALNIFIKSSGPSNCIVVKRNEERLILAALSTIYSFYIPTSLYNSLVSLSQYSPIRYFTVIQYNFFMIRSIVSSLVHQFVRYILLRS